MKGIEKTWVSLVIQTFCMAFFACPIVAADREALLRIQKRLEAAEAKLNSLDGRKPSPVPAPVPFPRLEAIPAPALEQQQPSFNDPKALAKALDAAIPSNKLVPRVQGGTTFACDPRLRLPYTGWAKQIGDHGRVRTLLHFKDGKLDGPFTLWRDNGWKLAQAHYKNGKQDGLAISWHANGRKSEERHYFADKLLTATAWKPSGEKCPQTNVFQGNGVVVHYHPDGTKEGRETFRGGLLVE